MYNANTGVKHCEGEMGHSGHCSVGRLHQEPEAPVQRLHKRVSGGSVWFAVKRHADTANVETSSGDDVPWTWVAEDMHQWSAMEATFVAKVLSKTRWMVNEDPEAM